MDQLASPGTPHFISSAWEVLVLFLIPIGGGIPAGVVLGHARGLSWPVMSALYFVSDLILASLFEPLLRLLKRSGLFTNFAEAYKQAMDKIVSKTGARPTPFALVMISFGVDPMTGRTAALAAGHGFVMGWAFAIVGDMLFFVVVMASTLWLNKFLGDGTWAAVIITVATIGLPILFRFIRDKLR